MKLFYHAETLPVELFIRLLGPCSLTNESKIWLSIWAGYQLMPYRWFICFSHAKCVILKLVSKCVNTVIIYACIFYITSAEWCQIIDDIIIPSGNIINKVLHKTGSNLILWNHLISWGSIFVDCNYLVGFFAYSWECNFVDQYFSFQFQLGKLNLL